MKQDYISNGTSKDIIISLLNDGYSARQISNQTGAVISTIYKYAREINIKHKGNQSSCEQYADRIIELVNKGYGYRTIAKEIDVHRNNIRLWLRKKNIKPKEQKQILDVEEISKRVSEKGCTYIGGYTDASCHITIRCNKCGSKFKRVSTMFMEHKKDIDIKCYNCLAIAREEREQIGKQTRYIKSAIKKCKNDKQRQRQLLYKVIAKRISQIHFCSNCGVKIFKHKYKYCNKCKDQVDLEKRRRYYKVKETNRRMKIKSNLVDRDITVKKLYQRDKGICYICNKATDLNDYVTTDKTIICGSAYPSIDHVIPLSKGGEHSWKNVKLAHRKCNWEKSDRTTV